MGFFVLLSILKVTGVGVWMKYSEIITRFWGKRHWESGSADYEGK